MAIDLVHRTLRRSHPPDLRPRLVVVGYGRAGRQLVEDLRISRKADRFNVTVLDADDCGRPGSGTLAVNLRSGVRALRIDRFAKAVLSNDGHVTPYDVLILAIGGGANLDLAVLSALPVQRGVLVDRAMRVLDEEHIYAIGACADGPRASEFRMR